MKFNLARQLTPSKPDWSPYPVGVKIETGGSCNQNCIGCCRKALPNRNKQMTLAQVEEILTKVPTAVYWVPYGYNEPTIHPQFVELCKLGNDMGVKLKLSTNCIQLTPEKLDQITTLDIINIRVSVNGVGQRYEEIHRSNWDRLVQNLSYAARICQETNIDLGIYSVVWSWNITEIPKLINFAESLNLPIEFIGSTYHKQGDSLSTKETSIRESEEYVPYINQMKEIGKNASVPVRFAVFKKQTRRCHFLWETTFIDVIGDIYGCSCKELFYWKLGNIFEANSIDEIYNNEAYRKIRLDSLQGKIWLCNNCIGWAPGWYHR